MQTMKTNLISQNRLTNTIAMILITTETEKINSSESQEYCQTVILDIFKSKVHKTHPTILIAEHKNQRTIENLSLNKVETHQIDKGIQQDTPHAIASMTGFQTAQIEKMKILTSSMKSFYIKVIMITQTN